jgi:hypothetical protein
MRPQTPCALLITAMSGLNAAQAAEVKVMASNALKDAFL